MKNTHRIIYNGILIKLLGDKSRNCSGSLHSYHHIGLRKAGLMVSVDVICMFIINLSAGDWCAGVITRFHLRTSLMRMLGLWTHDDTIKWKHFPHYWPFVLGIHQSPVNSPHKGQWHGALMFSLICIWINDWVNNHAGGDLRLHHGHYDVTVMIPHNLTHSDLNKIQWFCLQILKSIF